jgi:hypothetical protein
LIAIVGGVIGSVLLLIAIGIVVLVLIVLKRRRRRRKQTTNTTQTFNTNPQDPNYVNLNSNSSTHSLSLSFQTDFVLNLCTFDINFLSPFVSQIETEQQNQNQNQSGPQSEVILSNYVVLQQSQIKYNELVIEKEIGEGSYGKVCFGKWNGAPVALKFCRNKAKLGEFMQEVRLIMYVCECE